MLISRRLDLTVDFDRVPLRPCLYGGSVTQLKEGNELSTLPLLFFPVSLICEVGLPQEEGNPTCLLGSPF